MDIIASEKQGRLFGASGIQHHCVIKVSAAKILRMDEASNRSDVVWPLELTCRVPDDVSSPIPTSSTGFTSLVYVTVINIVCVYMYHDYDIRMGTLLTRLSVSRHEQPFGASNVNQLTFASWGVSATAALVVYRRVNKDGRGNCCGIRYPR